MTADRPFDHDNFGSSVALSGTTALVGADGQAVGRQRYAGAAYVEELASVPLLSLKASTRSLKLGKRVTLSGAVQNFLAADKTVVIARKVGSRVMPSKNVSISRSGAFRWTMKATRTGRWIVTASYAVGATTYTSNVVKVIVHK